MERYGFHRVIEPPGNKVLPQSAIKLDNKPQLLNNYEVLLDVRFLNLDSTSMKQLLEEAKKDIPTLKNRILQIVNVERGKMHNPVTNSGGVMLGYVKSVGSGLRSSWPNEGDAVIPLASLSCIPLHIESIGEIVGDRVEVKGTAVINGLIVAVRVPNDFDPVLVLGALDVSRALPLTHRRMVDILRTKKQKQVTVLVLGCGKAGISCIAYLRRKWPSVKILAADVSTRLLEEAQKFLRPGIDVAERIDAQNVGQVYRFVAENTPKKDYGADLVLSCVNVPYVEASSIVATKTHGQVMFFSMATQFDRAALCTDGVAKDCTLFISGGVDPNQADYMFKLLRRDERLLEFFRRESAHANL